MRSDLNQDSDSENVNEGASKEASRPSQEAPSSEITEKTNQVSEENKTEIVDEPVKNITEIVEKNETEIVEEKPKIPKEKTSSIKTFTNLCEETCDVSSLNLNKTSYVLKIEITIIV